MKNKIFFLYKDLYKKFGVSPSSVKARNTNQQNLRFKHLVSLIDIKKNDKVLDVGCGFGDLSYYLKKNKISCNYLGVDFVEEFINTANTLYSNNKTKFLKFDINKDKFPKNYDWLILKCATTGKINNIQIDTHHFKGNYPDKCSLQAAYVHEKTSNKSIVNKSKKWKLLLNKVKLHAHKKHNFKNKLMKNKKVNYIRINIYPDGGISRIRAFGKSE